MIWSFYLPLSLFFHVSLPLSTHMNNIQQDGKSFIIQNQAQFAREILPLNYKHNNMASFIRQLNMCKYKKNEIYSNWNWMETYVKHMGLGALCSVNTCSYFEIDSFSLQIKRVFLWNFCVEMSSRGLSKIAYLFFSRKLCILFLNEIKSKFDML